MQPFDYLVVDLETTIRNKDYGNNKASPHYLPNECVLIGLGNGFMSRTYTPAQTEWLEAFKMPTLRVVVGHNLPFDAQWLLRMGVDISKFNTWDTALAEYVLSGQQSTFPSLNALSVKYGLPVKDSAITDAWAAGVDTSDIPLHVLEPYCKQDVDNTKAIFLQQIEEAHSVGCLPLIMMLNDAQMACTHMMYNGMAIDITTVYNLQTSAEARLEVTRSAFNKHAARSLLTRGVTGNCVVDIQSPKQLSAFLFGGELSYTQDLYAGEYKTGPNAGKPKYVKKTFTVEVPRLLDPKSVGAAANTGGFTTADDVLENITAASAGTTASICARLALYYRKLHKQATTYYKKLIDLTYPDNFIHHNINSTATKTGRFSSSDPNLQNQTAVVDGEVGVKHCFVSRFGDDGYIFELDFKQLEIVGLAELSGDEQLRHDVDNEVDIHTELYKGLYGSGRPPTKEERRQVKRAVFAMLYGASAKRISELTGISQAASSEFIRLWARRYPGTVRYWEKHARVVRVNRVPSDRRDEATTKPLGISQVPAITGRILTYNEYIGWDGKPSFSPTEMRNYPIQSFATGDIVPAVIARIFKRLQANELLRDKAVLVNTVHDSIVLDVHKDVLEDVIALVRKLEQDIPSILKDDLNIDVKCKYRVGMSYGPNWGEQQEVT